MGTRLPLLRGVIGDWRNIAITLIDTGGVRLPVATHKSSSCQAYGFSL